MINDMFDDKYYETDSLEKCKLFAEQRNYHMSNTSNPIDFPKPEPKYWTICFPGEFGQSVTETWTEDQIIKSYYGYWNMKMIQAGKHDQINREQCIMDWCTIHWAVQTDKWGNKHE